MDKLPTTYEVEALLHYCARSRRVCPTPRVWDRLWQLLPERERSKGSWEPLPPLILAAWHVSTDLDKRCRLTTHIHWAASHGSFSVVEAFLRALSEDQWHYEPTLEEQVLRKRSREERRDRAKARAVREAASHAAQKKLDADHARRKPSIDAAYLASLDLGLISAYRSTQYHVFSTPFFVLRVDQRSEELAALFEQSGVGCAAYVTAWNPLGMVTPDDINAAAHEQLRSDMRVAGYPFLDGEGRGISGDWPPETSILILGLPRTAAKKLGRRYRQNAILWAGADAIPNLIMLMKPPRRLAGS